MEALLLHIYFALFSICILLSALLIFPDIRRCRDQEQPGTVVRDHPWTTAAAFIFDLIQACLSVAGVVGLLLHWARVLIGSRLCGWMRSLHATCSFWSETM